MIGIFGVDAMNSLPKIGAVDKVAIGIAVYFGNFEQTNQNGDDAIGRCLATQFNR